MALVLGLYLYDSALLLHSNEAIMTARKHGGWLVGFGSNKTTFMGKELYVPNPLTPVRRLFRVAWSYEPVSAPAAEGVVEPRDDLANLVVPVWSLLALLFLFLPAALFGRMGEWLLLAVLALVYANLLVIAAVLWVSRRTLQLGLRAYCLLAADLFLCPPFALNIIRKISLKTRLPVDLVEAARKLQSSSEWEITKHELMSRLDEEIATEDEGVPRMAELRERRREIETGEPCVQF